MTVCAREESPAGVFVGLSTLDLVQHISPVPAADAKGTATWQELCGGGPALNAAVVFAALGGRATLVTRLGPGAVADLVRADLAAHGVRVVDFADDDYSLAVSAIAVDPDRGTRQIISTDAGRVAAPIDRLPPQAAEFVAHADVVLLDGHHPDLAAATLEELARADRATPVVLDAGRWKPAMAQLLPRCTDVICSAAFRLPARFAGTSADQGPPASRDAPDLAGDALLTALVRGGAQLAAISDSSRPLRWRTQNAPVHELPVPPLPMPPLPVPSPPMPTPPVPPAGARSGDSPVADTLGAGDVLHGAYAWARARSRRNDIAPSRVDDAVFHRCLGVATTVASSSCAHRGTRSWLADLEAEREVLLARLPEAPPGRTDPSHRPEEPCA